MIRDGAYIDFEMMFHLISDAAAGLYSETEVLLELKNNFIQPRAFIPEGVVEYVTHFLNEDTFKDISTKRHVTHLSRLLGPTSKNPIEGYIE